jgi:hypothetical protein
MQRTVSYWLMTVLLSGEGARLTSAPAIQAEVRQAQATPYRPDAPDVAAFNVQSSFYDMGSIKYQPCAPLPPGEAAQFANLPVVLVLLKSQLAGLGNAPVRRTFSCVTWDHKFERSVSPAELP